MPEARCGHCLPCLAKTRAILRPSVEPSAALPGAPTPTRAELERHVDRFGNRDKIGVDHAKKTVDAALRVAAEHGITTDIQPIKLPSRGTNRPTLKARVQEHLDEGRSIELIAELEQITPSRARRLVHELTDLADDEEDA